VELETEHALTPAGMVSGPVEGSHAQRDTGHQVGQILL
jgi:hypothetical protein